VYTSKNYGSIIQLELSNSCFKTISVSEFGQSDRKLLVENDKSIKEYRNANQIIQLQEYDEGSATNPQILIFNEELKSKVYGIDQLFSASSANEPLNSGTSNSSSKTNLPNKDGIYEAVEVAPMPQGGMAGWNNYLAANLTYPTSARRMGIEGTVVVGFVVDTDGSISNIEILRGIGGGCDEEVIRIVKGAPRWTPGLQNGKAVRTFMRLPLSFKLGE
jgi:TonB family protein